MSLKAFHIFFIGASILLSWFVGAWGVREYVAHQSQGGLLLGVFFFVAGFALLFYGLRFIRKVTELDI